MYVGTLNGSKVCVNRIRVHSEDGPTVVTIAHSDDGPAIPIKVHHRRHHFPGLPLLTRLADPVQGGRGVETLETQKHRPTPRYHFHSTPTHLRVDARRGSHRVHYGTP